MPAYLRACLLFIANTGMRDGQALATRTTWIDFARKTVRYPASVVKQKRRQVVELNEQAVAALREALATTTDPARPFPYSYDFLIRRWRVAREKVGRPTLRIHDLRHSYISTQLDAGTPIHVVRDLAGHASVATTQLYAHTSDEARRAAVGRVGIAAPAGGADDGKIVVKNGKHRVVKPKNAPQERVVSRHDTSRDTKLSLEDRQRALHAARSGVGHEGLEPSACGLRAIEDRLRGVRNRKGISKSESGSRTSGATDGQARTKRATPVASLEDVQRKHLSAVMRRADGDAAVAAAMLGMHAGAFRRKLRALGFVKFGD